MTAKDEKSNGKAKLSKNLLQMKFMKRTALKEEVEEQEEEKRMMEDADHWTVPDLGHKERSVLVERSYTVFEDLRYGRMSFRGFNPAIEKIMRSEQEAVEDMESEKREEENAVSDDDMVERYNSLIHTMNKKFDKKNQRKSRREQHDETETEVKRKSKKRKGHQKDGSGVEEGPSRGKKFKKPAD